ncbi:MAG: SRPBCC domain-containing protein [Flavobacterium sp.]
MDTLKIKTGIQIAKPAGEVFEAIVSPQQIANYFLASSSGRIEEGAHLVWRFPEFDEDVPVRAGKIIKDKLISVYWENEGGHETLIEFDLEDRGDKTVVTVTEGTMPNDDKGIKWLGGNTEGWSYFLAFLKAWLEHGINMRPGAFDYRF